MKKLIIIYGPTAVGKSDFGEQLARKLHGEIINEDMGQCYTPLTIGTAKPDWQHSDIPHHLFDIVDSPRNITVVDIGKNYCIIYKKIFSQNKTTVLSLVDQAFTSNHYFFHRSYHQYILRIMTKLKY